MVCTQTAEALTRHAPQADLLQRIAERAELRKPCPSQTAQPPSARLASAQTCNVLPLCHQQTQPGVQARHATSQQMLGAP